MKDYEGKASEELLDAISGIGTLKKIYPPHILMNAMMVTVAYNVHSMPIADQGRYLEKFVLAIEAQIEALDEHGREGGDRFHLAIPRKDLESENDKH